MTPKAKPSKSKKTTRRKPAKPKQPPPLTEDERRQILQEIARNPSNRSAQIQALRFLKELDDGKPPPAQGFAALDK